MMSKVDLISNNPLINPYNRKLKLQEYLKTFIVKFKENVSYLLSIYYNIYYLVRSLHKF